MNQSQVIVVMTLKHLISSGCFADILLDELSRQLNVTTDSINELVLVTASELFFVSLCYQFGQSNRDPCITSYLVPSVSSALY